MAAHPHNTPSGVNESGLSVRGLLRSHGAPCRILSQGEALALLDDHGAELPPEPLSAENVRHGGAGSVCPAAKQTSDPLAPNGGAPLPTLTSALSRRREIFGPVETEPRAESFGASCAETAALDQARLLHARRDLEAALDHGTALLAALGLPPLPSMTRAMKMLDALDAPEADLEPWLEGSQMPGMPLDAEADDDGEPWLGWITHPSGAIDFGTLSNREEEADDEPSLGAPETHEGSQEGWARGSSSDREGDVADEPHDGDGDKEPSIGWPEDFTAKLDDVLQADHDPEFDDADLERSFTDACEAEDPVWMASRSTRQVAHV